MNIEKMREEFEEWVWNKYRDVFWYELDRAHVFKPYKEGFQTEFLNVRWEAWQASRAAIVIQTPEESWADGGCNDDGDDIGWFQIESSDWISAIEAAGIRIKP